VSREPTWHDRDKLTAAMSIAHAVSVDEYLNTSYRPDCEYLEGELLERNVGEFDHSRLQISLASYLRAREKQFGILALTAQRVQVKANRFRVPDITVLLGPPPAGQIVTTPPFLCIEILSPSDRLTEMQERIDDYINFGVQYVWVINPRNHRSSIYRPEGVEEVKNGILTTKNLDIRVPLAEIE